MKIIAQSRGRRIIQLDDGTYLEQRVELIGRVISCSVESYEMPEVRSMMEAAARDALRRAAQIRQPYSDFDALGWESRLIEWREDDVDQDGEPVEYFEPYTIWEYRIERGYWPLLPEQEAMLAAATDVWQSYLDDPAVQDEMVRAMTQKLITGEE